MPSERTEDTPTLEPTTDPPGGFGTADPRPARSGPTAPASPDPMATDQVDSQPAPPIGPYSIPRGLIILLGVAGAVVAVAGMKQIANIVAPTFLGLTLVISVHPLQTLLVRRRMPKWLAGLLCLLAVYVVVIGIVGALALSVAQLVIVMPTYTGKFVDLYNGTLAWLGGLGIDQQQLSTALKNFNPTTLIPAATSLLSSTLGATTIFVFLLTVLVFIVMDSTDIPHRLQLAANERPHFVAALDAFAAGVRRYWLVSAVFGLIVAILDVVGLYILSVPLALVWGLLAFITNFIPNIGFVLGVVPPALLGLLDGGVKTMILVIVIYSALNLVIQVIIQPKFTGDAVGVTTTVSFLSLAFWGSVLGPLGALLALPATLFVKTLLVDADPRNRWMNSLISSNPR